MRISILRSFAEQLRNLCTYSASFSPFQKLYEITAEIGQNELFTADEKVQAANRLAHKIRVHFGTRLNVEIEKGAEAFKQCAADCLREIQELKTRTATREGFTAYLNE